MSGNVTDGWINSRVQSTKVSTTQSDVTSSTSAVLVPGLQHKLFDGVTYKFEAYLTGTAGASGGAKFAIASVSQLTAVSSTCTGKNYNGTTLNANSTTTTLGNAVGAATAVFTDVYITGTITVATPGSVGVFMAQNASNATTSSVYVGSWFSVTPVVK